MLQTLTGQNGFFMARQPIYDRDVKHVAYELLYRKSDTAFTTEITTEDEMIALANVLIEVGLHRLACDKEAFLNVPECMLGSHALRLLPTRNVTLEILEDTRWNETVSCNIQDLKVLGYRLALDDYVFDDRHDKFLPLMDVIKVDVEEAGEQLLRNRMPGCKRAGQKWIAEKVETPEQFDLCRSLGFDLFQGYFFAKPKIIRGSGVRAVHPMSMNLLARIQDPHITMAELEKLIIVNIALCHKVFRLVNCVANGLPRKVDSIKQALLFLGIDKIRTLATLAIISGISGKTPELYRMAMIRARICENAARENGFDTPDKYFMLGMFSLIDALIDLPMAEALAELPLPDDVREALLGNFCDSQCDKTLKCAREVELGHWEQVLETLPAVSPDIFIKATAWAREQERSLAA